MPDAPAPFDTVEQALDAIAAGQLVIVTDDEDRENEGDLVMAASLATPERVNMMIRHARGLICVPTIEPQLRRLGLNPMVPNNRESQGTDFTVSVDAAEGITTGISAADRCRAIRILGDPEATADQLVQPGHIFPLRARAGGVLQRAGHTEAAVDLATLAGLPPAGVICEILQEDGSVARLPELLRFKAEFGLPLISIKQLIEYRLARERLIEPLGTQPLRNAHGSWTLHLFRSIPDRRLHFALTMGQLTAAPTLVRVHSENVLQDIFGVTEGRSHAQVLEQAMQRIAAEGRGAVLYLTQPCAGLQLSEMPPGAASCQLEAAQMDFRAYGTGAQILVALGLRDIRLLSTSVRRHIALDAYDLRIVEQVSLG